ncbi:MAG: glycosyltransferase family 4 protein [Bacteroidota bacterium]|nr:glycosyltransferase family 4 protein [Bacteroidota bacterium]
MMVRDYLIFTTAALLASALVTGFLLRYLRRKGVMDIPNERSSHVVPTPRGGGLGIVVSVLSLSMIYILITGEYRFIYLLAPALVMSFVGWLDDYKGGLPSGIRFLAQIVLALIVILAFGGIEYFPFPAPLDFKLGYASIPISLIWIVGVTNIYNFLDGIDGFAGTQGILAAFAFAAFSMDPHLRMISLITGAACVGFLLYNWSPARIFMGDVSSAFLGFFFASLPFLGTEKLCMSLTRTDYFFAMGVFLWFFLSDGVFTMIRRIIKGEKIWVAHRSHLYQRLVISGLSHSRVVMIIGATALLLYAVFFIRWWHYKPTTHWYIILLMLGLFAVYWVMTIFRERKASGS